MQILKNICNSIEKITTIKSQYVYLALISILFIILIRLIQLIITKISLKRNINAKEKYLVKRKCRATATGIIIVILTLIWSDYLKNFLTLITFISTAITLSLKEIILNFFAGIYIRTSKIFSLEDRIEVNGLKGDIININKTSFDLLEVGDRVNGEQSTGRMVHVPNSVVFNYPLKNYVKPFKYVWDEMKLQLSLNSDISKVKKEVYKIVKKNNVINAIPEKMEHEVKDASEDYRIYYNNLEPIIYVEVVDGAIDMYVRFLVHPKKKRNVENTIWIDILKCYNNGKIQLIEKV